nr:MAG TPA: hypothetical protein [Caudoviricetes sp.]
MKVGVYEPSECCIIQLSNRRRTFERRKGDNY